PRLAPSRGARRPAGAPGRLRRGDRRAASRGRAEGRLVSLSPPSSSPSHPSRRAVLSGLGATAAAAALPGCGPETSDRSSAALSFWQFFAPRGASAAQNEWFDRLVTQWNQNNEAQVRLQFVPNSQYVGGPKLQTAFSAEDGPDVFVVSPGDFLRYSNGGVLEDLSPHMTPADGRTSTRTCSPAARSTRRSTRFRWVADPWRCTTRCPPSSRPDCPRGTSPRPGTSCSTSRTSSPPTSSSDWWWTPVPPTTRTSPSTRSCGWPVAASPVTRTRRATSTRRERSPP